MPEVADAKNDSFNTFGHAVILTSDLLTPKPNQFSCVPRCISDKNLVN